MHLPKVKVLETNQGEGGGTADMCGLLSHNFPIPKGPQDLVDQNQIPN